MKTDTKKEEENTVFNSEKKQLGKSTHENLRHSTLGEESVKGWQSKGPEMC